MNDLYTFTVPVFKKTLGGLKNVLQKAQAELAPEAQSALMSDALAPDMFPFKKQVQSACDNAKGCAARLAGVEIPSFADTEATIPELIARVEKTIAFLDTITEAQFVDAASRKIELSYFPGKYMTGFDYAREYAVPNFFFHAVTAYGLVRKALVTIGKGDYINGTPLRDNVA